MASTAIPSQGTALRVAATPGAGGTPDTVIGNVRSFNGLDGEAAEIDVTNLASAAKEKRTGLSDFGNFQMEYHPDYSDAGQNILRGGSGDGNVYTFDVTLFDGSIITFDAVIRNAHRASAGVDAVVEGGCALSVSGFPTYS